MALLNGSTMNAGVRSIFAQYKYIGTQMSPVISGVTRQKFTKFLDDVAHHLCC